jgi:hypothetical protein
MRDLEVWRRLGLGTATAADLRALAAWPLSRRAPYFGRIAPLVEHCDPEIRAAAVESLAGARGVPGVRAIVGRLADLDDRVRAAALTALRVTARDAPMRYAHALFHPRADVRIAALVDLPHGANELVAYLRADPACAALVADAPWPSAPLPLAFDLHATNRLTDRELVALVMRSTPAELRGFFEAERGRPQEVVDAYLDDSARTAAMVAPGTDVIDQVVAAIEVAGTDERGLEHFITAVTLRKRAPLVLRAVTSLLSRIATGKSPVLAALCGALEPRTIGYASFDRSLAAAAASGLIRFRWPIRPTAAQIDRLLELPFVRADLALAAAICGLHSNKRLAKLAAAIGEHAIIERLVAGDHGWDQICQVPGETPALEQKWLARIERAHPGRYTELAGRALGVFAGKRLEAFVDQVPRRYRDAALLHLVATGGLVADDTRFVAVCRAIGSRIERAGFTTIFAALLAGTDHEAQLVVVLARSLTDKLLAAACQSLDDVAVARLVAMLDGLDALPRDLELALAAVLAGRTHPVIRAWADRVGRMFEATPEIPLPTIRARRALRDDERAKIRDAAEPELGDALKPALIAPVTGLVEALAARTGAPSGAACVALLGCADPLDDVARQLDRFVAARSTFDDEVDNAAARRWRTATDLPPLAHARLFRWEAHTTALAGWIDEAGGPLRALTAADALPGRFAAVTLWRGIAETLVLARYRDRPRFLREAKAELAQFAAERVDRDVGRYAARIVVTLVEAGAVPLSAVRAVILDRTADADRETRAHLVRLVRLDGMPEPPRSVDAAPAAVLLDQIRAIRDLDALVTWCSDPRVAIVQEAVLALLVAGELGQLRLAGLLARLGELPSPVPVLASISLWDSPAAIAAARALAAATERLPEWQFHLCLALRDAPGALAAAAAPSTNWFRRRDWEALVEVAEPVAAAVALADSHHHHAYSPALAVLLEMWDDVPVVAGALRRFLEAGIDRPLHLRRAVANRLAKDWDDLTGLPILIEQIVEDGPGTGSSIDTLPTAGAPIMAEAVVSASLIGGHTACSEKRMWTVVQRLAKVLEPAVLGAIYLRTLEEASSAAVRRMASQLAVGEVVSHTRLVAIAEVFAWGVRRGVELTGRLFRIHMTSKERDLGHTFLDGNRVFVSPLPMLRHEAHGQDVVEGLLLHEIGHHVYHRGAEAQALWKQAHQEGIGHLLNLVADEHLERNLRGVDAAYGDRLKRLDAYAFQHAPQELRVAVLLGCLRGSAATALIGAELDVAFEEASVRLRRGAVITELERAGHPLARFARALRMGLGNRYADPRVAAALELCGKDLRRLDMRGLYDLTRELAAMFGGAISIASVFGGPEGLEFGERDDDVFGAGIDDEALQREVERILDPRSGKRGKAGPRDRLAINVNPRDEFDKITHIQRVVRDAEEHRRVAAEVNRHATRLRAHLDDLGLRWDPARARIKGHTLDRTRLRALVTRNDPRILIARTPVRRTDLFLGTLIDCSGSMSAGKNIERARRFAVLIAEAVRPLQGVEARFFGFTDSVIYDAGDALDCGVTSLVASGGNNDAAALFHAANIAAASRKRARVLVMISDGLPTECSVAALRNLATQLSRRKGIVCAQVAVRRLEEECFPHHVVLDDAEINVAVARFGRMIADLARKGLAS